MKTSTNDSSNMAPRLLIVDDAPGVSAIMAEMLARAGYECTVTTTPSAALNQFAQREFQLAIVDVHLPEMSGLELACRFFDRRPDMPVLFTTGAPEEWMVDPPARFQALPKPFTGREFLHKVSEMMSSLSVGEQNAGRRA